MILQTFLSLVLSLAMAQEKVQIKTVSPQGFAKSVDQVRVEFAKPMVKLGEIHLSFPAQSECFKDGQGRWVDTKNWVYDFKTTLKGGTSCAVKVGDKQYTFNTGGPHIESVFPREYRPIEPDQNFILVLDSPVKKETVAKGAYFVIAGLGDRIPAQLVDGSEAEKIRNAAKVEYKWDEEEFKKSHWVVIKSPRAFPASAEVSLVWGKEVQSASGSSSPENETFGFNVAEPFKAQFSCEREAANKPCIPILGFRLSFSSSISVVDAKKIYLEATDKSKIYASGLDDPKDKTTMLEFKGPFPRKAEYRLILPNNLRDEGGRELSNKSQYPLLVKTGEDPALLKFAGSFGVVESGPNAAIPVTLRRVEKSLNTQFQGLTGQFSVEKFAQILKTLNAIESDPYGPDKLKVLSGANVKKIKIEKPLKSTDTEVVGIPLKENGFYAVEMESPLLGQSLLDKKSNYYVRTAALVTDLAAHIKYSDDEAWVWVTRLKDATVVANAKVSIYDVKGQVVAEATSDKKGLAVFRFKKPVSKFPTAEEGRYTYGFFAVAQTQDDFTFTHSSWSQGIETWRFQLGLYGGTEPLIGHAILDRSLLRPEETLSSKILLRKENEKGLGVPGEKEWPTHLVLEHESGIQKFELPLKWDKKKGSTLIKWTLPSVAKMGNWSMTLRRDKVRDTLNIGSFVVEAFRIPLMQVKIESSSPTFTLEKNVDLRSAVQYFSGGPAADLPMKVRWSVEADGFVPQDSDYVDFSFANGFIKEGIFRSGEDEGARHIPQTGMMDVKTNSQGIADIKIKGLRYAPGPQRLKTEIEYKDPSGEIKTAIRSFGMWSSQMVVGIKAKSWGATPDLVEFDVVALDLFQKPLANQPVTVDIFSNRYYSHRKRLVGGFYAYEDFSENKKIGELCRGTTNAQGLFRCVGKSKVGGTVVAVARSNDKQGRTSYARTSQWVVEPGESLWFGSDDHDRADLLPFKKTYEPGEVAELQLRTPFPQAKVLVTVERDRVLYSEVVDVSGERPVIKIPIKKEFAPNVFISAYAIRGRMNDPKPTSLIDLGKPSMKLGMASIRVGINENTLKVAVTTDRKQYKARDKAEVTVKVQDFKGSAAGQGEVAIVAVDEGLLEIRDNNSWNLLREMMKPRGQALDLATAQTFVIGRRHFGLKALPIGGDGGGGLRRELFDTLLYWNPAVKLNAKGEAKVMVPLNDSTTSFRIVAIATQNLDQFGTGWTSIQSSQDLMIMPGIAGVARQGDEFRAGFTVRNASKERQDVDLTLQTTPAGNFAPQKLVLASGESKEIFWNMKVGSNLEKIDYIVTAKSPQGKFLDEIKKTQKVLAVRVPRIIQSEWGRLPEFAKIDLQAPQGAAQKSLIFEVTEGLGGSTTGLKEYWENYYFNCLEQQISRAISLNDKKLWQQISGKIPAYLDDRGLLKYFPSADTGSIALTAYVLSVVQENAWSLEESSKERMLTALNEYVEGRLVDREPQFADSALRKISSLDALSRYGRMNVESMSSIEVLPQQWPLYTVTEWYQVLLREKQVPNRAQALKTFESALRNKFYFSAKRLQLRDEGIERMPWIMRSSEGAIARLILATVNEKSWESDVPRLYLGLLSRQERGSWGTTVDNAWGRIMMDKVKAKFSKDKVEGRLQITLGKSSAEHSWAGSQNGSYELSWTDENQASWKQSGNGNPWMAVSVKAAVPVIKPVFAGFKAEKIVTPVTQKKKGVWSVGDVAKVQVKVTTAAPQSWVVIEDAIPAGASILQSSYATSTERKEELIRAYYSWFGAEETLEYTVRFNQSGAFEVPVTRVEAMYSPDLYAELPESRWVVQE